MDTTREEPQPDLSPPAAGSGRAAGPGPHPDGSSPAARADGDARAPGRLEQVKAEMRTELEKLTEKLGEQAIEGPWYPEHCAGFRRTSQLEAARGQAAGSLAELLGKRSCRLQGAERVELLADLWWQSWHLLDFSLAYNSLRAVEQAVRALVAEPGQGEPDWQFRARHAVGGAMSLVTTDADLFKLINLSDAGELSRAAVTAVETARRIDSDLVSLVTAGGCPPELARDLRGIAAMASQCRIFYRALAAAASALVEFENWLPEAPRLAAEDPVQAATRGRGDGAARRQQLLDRIGAAIDEVRRNRGDLMALTGQQQRDGLIPENEPADLVLSRCEPWERLLIDVREIVASSGGAAAGRRVLVPERVSVRYCYPFAVEASEQTRDRLKSLDKGGLTRALAGTGIGIAASELGPMTTTQFFARGTGLYEGVRVDLPDIMFSHGPPGAGSDEQAGRCTVWVNLCGMGNHCLCIEAEPLLEPPPHLLYRTLQAATPFALGARVTVPGTDLAWDSLHSFGRDVIEAITRAVFWPVTPRADRAKRFVRGNLHEILVVHTSGPLGMRPAEIATVLDRAVGGRILARSVQRAAMTIEEWVRYPGVPLTRSQGGAPAIADMPEMGLAGDWCTNTGETSVFGIVAAPSWHSDVYVEAAQFVCSWSPLLRLWSRRLLDAIKTAEADPDRQSDERLRHIEAQVRVHLAQTRADELCATLAHRRFLDQLLDMAGLGRLQSELEAQLAAAEHLTDWFSERARRTREQVQQKADWRRQVLLGAIALFGLFELGTFLTIVNTTQFGLSDVQHAVWEDWLMLIVLLLGLLFVFYVFNPRTEALVNQHIGPVARRLGPRRRRHEEAAGTERTPEDHIAMNAKLTFRDLRADPDEDLVLAVYRDILEPSFGPDELDTLDSVLDGLMPGGSYECWGLCAMDGDRPVGCVLGYPYPDSGVLLIGYVAVRPGERSLGIGGSLLDEARRRWYGKPGITLVLAEIDDPRCHPAVGGIDPQRRVAFYDKRGTEIVVGPYFQPRLEGEGKKRVYDLFLAVLHGGHAAAGGGRRSVPAHRIAGFLEEYFAGSGEGDDWPREGDTEGRWLLDWYRRDREPVSLYPIGRYAQAEIPRIPGRPAC